MQLNKILLIFLIILLPLNLFSQKSPNRYFIENRGQVQDQNRNPVPDILYSSEWAGGIVHLRKGGFSYETTRKLEILSDIPNPFAVLNDNGIISESKIYRVDVQFPEPSPNCKISTSEAKGPIHHFYNRVPSVLHVPGFEKVIYTGLYSGIDLVFYFSPNGEFKYDFVCHSSAVQQWITLNFDGCTVEKSNAGDIEIITPVGGWKETIPSAYFYDPITEFKRVVTAECSVSQNQVRIHIERPDSETEQFIIDPMPDQLWGTYFGGNNTDIAYDIATGNNGVIASTGSTVSNLAFATSGAHLVNIPDNQSSFLSASDSNGIPLWITYYGGISPQTSLEAGHAVSFQPSGHIIMGGITYATNGISTVGAHQPVQGGSMDGFLSRFSPDGILSWGTYFGGSASDQIVTLDCDQSGNIFVGGKSNSTSSITTMGAHQISNGGSDDGFLARFDSNGVRIWSTYIGGTGDDRVRRISCSPNGQIIVGGSTQSTTGISSGGSHQITYGGNMDGFIASFDPNGVRNWSTYYGGFGLDDIGQVGVSNNLIAVSGGTQSSANIATAGALNPNLNGSADTFIGLFDINGNRKWATYYGGSGNLETIFDLDINIAGDILVLGIARSSDGIAFPGAFQDSLYPNGSVSDLFIAALDSSGSIIFGSYFGAETSENAGGIAFLPWEAFVFNGSSIALNRITTPGAYQLAPTGGTDIFLEKFRYGCPSPPMNWSGLNLSNCSTDNISTINVSPPSTIISGPGISGNTFDPSQASPGAIGILFTYQDGCGTLRDSQVVYIENTPYADFNVLGSGPDFTFQFTGIMASDIEWDFGDGTFSGSINPIHTFTSPGTYTVCLNLISDFCGSDDTCQTVIVLPDAINYASIQPKIEIFPNPTTDNLTIRGISKPTECILIDSKGQIVAINTIFNYNTRAEEVYLRGLPKGIYFLILPNEINFTSNTIIKL